MKKEDNLLKASFCIKKVFMLYLLLEMPLTLLGAMISMPYGYCVSVILCIMCMHNLLVYLDMHFDEKIVIAEPDDFIPVYPNKASIMQAATFFFFLIVPCKDVVTFYKNEHPVVALIVFAVIIMNAMLQILRRNLDSYWPKDAERRFNE